ncbi:ATP-binding protein [Priestia koreensis]|uniref:ATP-binding protein n=1 Tax=Priestia koreensis TaxID=284581 RepID=A0A0M0L4H6_9BACI|nr:ATP-binding protein [Priestia koreensis]KOO45961.1 ATP-binding protein [Priestia koreensis]
METILTEPVAGPVINALRSIGYNPRTAIADIIDNSIDAKAKKIKLQFEYNDGNGYIQIIDNGNGMDLTEIQNAMSIGSKDPRNERGDKELGRFGMGLKTASFSLGKRLSVISKKNDVLVERCWDLDYVSQTNRWDLFTEIPLEVRSNIAEITSICGTVVYIDKLDRFMRAGHNPILANSFFSKVDRIYNHLSFVFHTLINEDLCIEINENSLDAWDPFLSSHDYTNPLRPRVLKDGIGKIKVSTYILPHASYLTPKEYKQAGGIKGWNEHQGFYIYRENRLLHFGNWLDIFPKDQASQLARVRIDITNKSDELWHVDIKKSMVSPPDNIKSQLKAIAREARDISKQVFYFRTQSNTSDTTVRSNINTWRQEDNETGTVFKLNRSHPLLQRIIEDVSDETVKNLKMFLKLVELGSPANIVIIPKVEEEKVQQISESDKSLISELANMYKQLMDSDSLDELTNIILMTPSMEKFNRNTIKFVIEEKDYAGDN